MNLRWLTVVLLLSACDASLPGAGPPAAVPPPAMETPLASGPPLTASAADLAASLVCSGDFSARAPVLLVHGTALAAGPAFDWNYVPALTELGIPFCTVQLLDNGMSDIQDSAEYVVYAIREMNRLSGRKIHVIGHSQGGMIPRWALRFWPDTREMVDDLVSLAGSNHGTVNSIPFCESPDGCAASFWQQTVGSDFITALNADGETYDTISYTNIFTYFDEVVVPNTPVESSSSLAGGANVANLATQELCPNNTGDHLALGSYDAVAFAAAMDAINSDGPAFAVRIALDVCTEPFMPGVDPASFPMAYAAYAQTIGQSIQNAPTTTEEPALKCYVTESC